MTKTAGKYYPVYIAIILLLLIPALFINLGLLPLIADEATRAIVSLEMEFSYTKLIQGWLRQREGWGHLMSLQITSYPEL